MTIRSKQPDNLTVVVKKTITAHLTNPPENRRKCHCSFSDMLEWGTRTCVKSDWLSVIKSCGLCLVVAWMCWLQWSYQQLSMDVLKLKNEFSFRSRVELTNSQVKTMHSDSVSDFDVEEHRFYKHSERKKRRRRQRAGSIRTELNDIMKKNTYVLFLQGANGRTEEDYFRWNLTNAGSPDEFITINSNGTFVFKKEGLYLVASQLTIKGINNQQNSAISYGYETVLVKRGTNEVLMRSEITQAHRGVAFPGTSKRATDSVSHMVIKHFQRDEKVAIKAYTNGCEVNYYTTVANSYIGIVALDFWNI